jgi:hypothetical protein
MERVTRFELATASVENNQESSLMAIAGVEQITPGDRYLAQSKPGLCVNKGCRYRPIVEIRASLFRRI